MSEDNKTQEFIRKAKALHGDKYDYSQVVYEKGKSKVIIRCPIHNRTFEQQPDNHLQGKKCKDCGLEESRLKRTMTTEEFIAKAHTVHGDLYDYTKTVYTSSISSVTITCKSHGDFEKRAELHTGKGQGSGCPKCSDVGRRVGTELFIERSKKLHGEDRYDYSQVEYVTKDKHVTIICHRHPEPFAFQQTPGHHMHSGTGCPLCGGTVKSNTEKFIAEARKVHGDRYDYSQVVYVDNKTKVTVRCPIHDKTFYPSPSNHIDKGSGCPRCCESRGELVIANVLDSLHIKYIREYKFPNDSYRYDFYLPYYHIFIEFHGRQHYEHVEFFHKTRDEFLQRKYADKIKVKQVKAFKGRMIILHYKQLEQKVLGNSLVAQLKKLNIIT